MAAMLKRRLPILLLLALSGAGCATNKITNVTPRQVQRTPDNLYRIEARWDSNQRSIRKNTLQPRVIVDRDFHAMEPTPGTQNRWEALVPVPSDRRFVNYRFKFDYLYNAIPTPRPDSKISPTYQMEIIEP